MADRSGMEQVFGPCPSLACQHAYRMHDWEEPGVAPMCCVEGCDCGKGPDSAEARADDPACLGGTTDGAR